MEKNIVPAKSAVYNTWCEIIFSAFFYVMFIEFLYRRKGRNISKSAQ